MATAFLYVRMSTAAQVRGDSLRRQIENAEAYARHVGLEISQESFQDLGISAFDSSNVDHGQLGRFIAALESGRVPKGSYLLIESIDRLSRQVAHQAVDLLTRILKSGITIVSLIDREELRWPVEYGPLMMVIGRMNRAHDESAHKQMRLREAWKNKRNRIQNEKLTRRCPAWLQLNDDRKTFRIFEDRAKVVERIFYEAANGMGSHVITRRLNAEKIPPFLAKGDMQKGWHSSSVKKILSSRAVLGEFQPKLKDNRKSDAGPMMLDYFPAVVDQDLFYRAKAGLAKRRSGGGGRVGPLVSNLFSKVATCGYCGARMAYVNKGKNEHRYLVCERTRRGLDCHTAKAWRYDHFEASFFTLVTQFDLEAFFDGGRSQSELLALEHEEERCRGQVEATLQEHERMFRLFRTMAEPSSFFESQIIALDDELRNKKLTHETSITALRTFRETVEGRQRAKNNLPEYVERLQTGNTPDLYRVRSSVAASLRSSITSLNLFSDGDEVVIRASVGELMRNLRLSRSEAKILHERQKTIQPFHLPWFSVDFGGDRKVKIVPDPANCCSFLFKQDGPEILTHSANGEPLWAVADPKKLSVLF